MSGGLFAIGGVPPGVLFVAVLALAIVAAVLLALAPTLAEVLVRFRARRLPSALSERLLEEWLAEVHSVESRFGKLTFAGALALAPTKSLVEDTDDATLPPVPLLDFADVKVPTDFPIRLAAYALDGVIVLAVFKGMRVLLGLINAPLSDLLPPIFWTVAIDLYFVQRFGGSPGKILTKLRIVTMDGMPLTFKHAFLRITPNLLGGLVFNLAVAAMLLPTISYSRFLALTPAAQQQVIRDLVPLRFIGWYFTVGSAWFLADVIAFFASYERRPLHDRIAGTMVVHKIPAIPGPPYKLERPVW
jgi:uncharacterized RDD family membrane protein YckC